MVGPHRSSPGQVHSLYIRHGAPDVDDALRRRLYASGTRITIRVNPTQSSYHCAHIWIPNSMGQVHRQIPLSVDRLRNLPPGISAGYFGEARRMVGEVVQQSSGEQMPAHPRLTRRIRPDVVRVWSSGCGPALSGTALHFRGRIKHRLGPTSSALRVIDSGLASREVAGTALHVLRCAHGATS